MKKRTFEQRRKDVEDFFRVLFRYRDQVADHGGPYFEIRALCDNETVEKQKPRSALEGGYCFEDLINVIPDILDHSDKDIDGLRTLFIGIQPRTSPEGMGDEDVAYLLHLHVDVDFGTNKPFRTAEEAFHHIETRLFKPFLIVRTKNGFQVYIRLENPFLIIDEENKEIAKIALELVREDYKGDKHGKGISRVLRILYTWHRKDPTDPFLIHPIPCPDQRSYRISDILDTLGSPEPGVRRKVAFPSKRILVRRGAVQKALSHFYEDLLGEFPGPDGIGAHRNSFFIFRHMIERGWSDNEISEAFQRAVDNYPDPTRRVQWQRKLRKRLRELFREFEKGKLTRKVPKSSKAGRFYKTEIENPTSNINIVEPASKEQLWSETKQIIEAAVDHDGSAIVARPPGTAKTHAALLIALLRISQKVIFCFENIARIEEVVHGGMLDRVCKQLGIRDPSVKVILGRQDPDCDDPFRKPFRCVIPSSKRMAFYDRGIPMSKICARCRSYRNCSASGYLAKASVPDKGLILTTRDLYRSEPKIRRGAALVFVDESLLPYLMRERRLRTGHLKTFERNLRDCEGLSRVFEAYADALSVVVFGLDPFSFSEKGLERHLRIKFSEEEELTKFRDLQESPPWEKNHECPQFSRILLDLAIGLFRQDGTRVIFDHTEKCFIVKTPIRRSELKKMVSLDATPVIPDKVLKVLGIRVFGDPFAMPSNVSVHCVSEEIGVLKYGDTDPQIIETVAGFLRDPDHCAIVRKVNKEEILRSHPDLHDNIGHFGLDDRGTNRFISRKAIYLDRYQVNLSHIEELGRDFLALMRGRGVQVEPTNLSTRTCCFASPFPGISWSAYRIPFYEDPLLREVARLVRCTHYHQAFHRLRPMIRPGEEISVYIADARPVEVFQYLGIQKRKEFAGNFGVQLTQRADHIALDTVNLERRSKAERRRDRLKDLILQPDGSIPPISRERTKELAGELGCSESTLRDDIKKLTLLQNGSYKIPSAVSEQSSNGFSPTTGDDGLTSNIQEYARAFIPPMVPHKDFREETLCILEKRHGGQVRVEYEEKVIEYYSKGDYNKQEAEFNAIQYLVCTYEEDPFEIENMLL